MKDIINTAGLRTTWGSRLMANNVPDAVAVERLRKAGAIIVGKTTTSEFAHKLLTDAPLFGVTRNPWDLTPGGSSGGSAVAVAASLGPLSLATDAGASTRLPAALTGIVGLKPTLGVVPHNQVPDAFNNFIHLGLMARSVADTALMLDVIAGEHWSDPHSMGVLAPNALAAVRKGPNSKLRIAWRPFVGNSLLDEDVRSICEQALATFEEFGCQVETSTDVIDNAEPAWRILQQSNWAARFHARIDEVAPQLDPSFVEGIKAGGAYTGQQNHAGDPQAHPALPCGTILVRQVGSCPDPDGQQTAPEGGSPCPGSNPRQRADGRRHAAELGVLPQPLRSDRPSCLEHPVRLYGRRPAGGHSDRGQMARRGYGPRSSRGFRSTAAMGGRHSAQRTAALIIDAGRRQECKERVGLPSVGRLSLSQGPTAQARLSLPPLQAFERGVFLGLRLSCECHRRVWLRCRQRVASTWRGTRNVPCAEVAGS